MCSLGVLLLDPARAQQAAATGEQAAVPAAGDRAPWENYVRVTRSELERAEARVRAMTDQLTALDDDIESRINRMVSLLSSVRDSTDTAGTRIRREKEELLKALKATAMYYAQERDKRKKEIGSRYALIEEDELARNVAALNARIETRVTQSLAIASSLTQSEEGRVERYANTDTDYSNETREYQRSHRDAQASAKTKADLAATLHASIEKLSRDVSAREAELRATADPEKRERLSKDIETMRHTIQDRRDQIQEVVTAPKPSTRPVSGKGAFEMEQMLNEMTAELKRDFAKFRSLVNERDAACARVKPLKTRLERATAALEKMSTGADAAAAPGGAK